MMKLDELFMIMHVVILYIFSIISLYFFIITLYIWYRLLWMRAHATLGGRQHDPRALLRPLSLSPLQRKAQSERRPPPPSRMACHPSRADR